MNVLGIRAFTFDKWSLDQKRLIDKQDEGIDVRLLSLPELDLSRRARFSRESVVLWAQTFFPIRTIGRASPSPSGTARLSSSE